MMGVILVVGGLLRVGFVTDLLSKPIRIGYLNGIALVVIVGQLPKLLGFSVDATSFVGTSAGSRRRDRVTARPTPTALRDRARVARVDHRHAAAAEPGARRRRRGRGGGRRHRAARLGRRGARRRRPARGLPAPALQGLEWGDVGSLAGPALGIALIAFADTSVLSRTFAARHGTSVDGSQEMAAIGVANIAGGLLGGFPVSASASRTPVAEEAGARTQLVGGRRRRC